MVTSCSTSQLSVPVPRFYATNSLGMALSATTTFDLWCCSLKRHPQVCVFPGRAAWPSPLDTSMSLQDRHVNTVKQTEQEHGIHLLDPPPARKTHKMGLFCVWLERQGIESAFPCLHLHRTLQLIAPGHLGFVTLKSILCPDFHGTNLGL